MNRMRHFLVSLFFIFVIFQVFFFSNTAVSAQDENNTNIDSLQNVVVYVYPEYDDPRLLVIMEGHIPTTITLPADIQFLVPSSASMYSAGSIDAMGNYSGGPPERAASDTAGWDIIQYHLTSSVFRMEYYDPVIMGKTDKTIRWEFHPLYPITNLNIYIQEPLKSINFKVIPEGQVIKGQKNYTFHLYSYPNVPSEHNPFEFNVNYTKSDTRTSLEIAKSSSVVPIIAGSVAGILVILGVILFFMRPKRIKQGRKSDKNRKVKTAVLPQSTKNKSKSSMPSQYYCHQCGEILDKKVHFCPYCGAEQ